MVKNPPANTGHVGLILELGRSPGGGNGKPLQYSYLGNSVGRVAWLATVHGGHKQVGHDLATKPQPQQNKSVSCIPDKYVLESRQYPS